MAGQTYVTTCIIFLDVKPTQHDQLPKALHAVCLDANGQVDVALALHSLDDIRDMQVHAERNIIVISAAHTSLFTLNLPKLSEKKAREAIPYALEDMLAEPVSDVHVAFRRDSNHPERYFIVAVNKLCFLNWLNLIDGLDLTYDAITIDWCALKPQQAVITDEQVLICQVEQEDVASKPFNGAISVAFAPNYFSDHTQLTWFCFDDSFNLHTLSKTSTDEQLIKGSFRLYIAQALLNCPILDLCQGVFQKKDNQINAMHIVRKLGGLVLTWGLTILFVNGLFLHHITTKTKQVESQVVTLYQLFFPGEPMLAHPKFRIEQHLKQKSVSAQDPLFVLLNGLSSAKHQSPVDIRQFRYHDNRIEVQIVATKFSDLDVFTKKLETQELKVKQKDSSMQNGQAISNIEITQ